MKLKKIAARIDAHLHKREKEPAINTVTSSIYPVRRFFQTNAYASGNRVYIIYRAYQGFRSLTKAEAMAYLAWIEAGNVGEHYEMRDLP